MHWSDACGKSAAILAPWLEQPSAHAHSVAPVIAKVEPLTSARALRGPFDYKLPVSFDGVDVGSMLVVPFGRQRMLGVVVGLAEESEIPDDRLVEPLTALDPEVPAELVRLGLWVAEEYCSTPARGLGLVLPPGTGRNVKPRVRARLALVAELVAAGREALLAGGDSLGERQHAALQVLRAGPLPAAALSRESGCSHASLRALAERGLISLERQEVARRPELARVGARGGPEPTLSEAQRIALEEIVRRIDAGDGRPRPAPRRHRQRQDRGLPARGGRGARAAVAPRSCWCPRSRSRRRRRGASRSASATRVAVLHSKLGAGERYDEWARLRSGEARVCVGPALGGVRAAAPTWG